MKTCFSLCYKALFFNDIHIVYFTISKYSLIVESTICIVDNRKKRVIVGSTIRVKCFIFKDFSIPEREKSSWLLLYFFKRLSLLVIMYLIQVPQAQLESLNSFSRPKRAKAGVGACLVRTNSVSNSVGGTPVRQCYGASRNLPPLWYVSDRMLISVSPCCLGSASLHKKHTFVRSISEKAIPLHHFF